MTRDLASDLAYLEGQISAALRHDAGRKLKCKQGYIQRGSACQKISEKKAGGDLARNIGAGLGTAALVGGAAAIASSRKQVERDSVLPTSLVGKVSEIPESLTRASGNSASIKVGAALLGISATTYGAAVIRYNNGFKESAKIAKRESAELDVDYIPDDKKQVTFTVGGFYGLMGEEARRKGESYLEYKLKTGILPEDHYTQVHENIGYNADRVKSTADTPVKYALEFAYNHYKQTIGTVIGRGYNPEARKLAAKILAYHEEYPDKPINSIGHSAGGIVNREVAKILQIADPKSKNWFTAVNLGSAHYGLIPNLELENVKTIAIHSDGYLTDTFGGQMGLAPKDTIWVGDKNKKKSGEDHLIKAYMSHPEVKNVINSMLNRSEISRYDGDRKLKCKGGYVQRGSACQKIAPKTGSNNLARNIGVGLGAAALVGGAAAIASKKAKAPASSVPEFSLPSVEPAPGVDSKRQLAIASGSVLAAYLGIYQVDRKLQISTAATIAIYRTLTENKGLLDDKIDALPISKTKKNEAKGLMGLAKLHLALNTTKASGLEITSIDRDNNSFTYKGMGGSVHTVSSYGSTILKFNTIEKERVNGAYLYEMNFTANESFNRGTETDSVTAKKIIGTANKVFKDHVSLLPDECIVRCQANKEDGRGASRKNIYQKNGFTPIDNTPYLYILKTDGQLKPIVKESWKNHVRGLLKTKMSFGSRS